AISHSGPELSQVPGLRPVSASATGASPVYPSTGTERGFGEPQMNANERRYDQSLFSEHVSEGRRPLAGSVRPSQVRSGQVRFGQGKSGSVRASQVRSGQVRFGQGKSEFGQGEFGSVKPLSLLLGQLEGHERQ